jgi:hypothetical protein
VAGYASPRLAPPYPTGNPIRDSNVRFDPLGGEPRSLVCFLKLFAAGGRPVDPSFLTSQFNFRAYRASSDNWKTEAYLILQSALVRSKGSRPQ